MSPRFLPPPWSLPGFAGRSVWNAFRRLTWATTCWCMPGSPSAESMTDEAEQVLATLSQLELDTEEEEETS